jgi:hypothetical protein
MENEYKAFLLREKERALFRRGSLEGMKSPAPRIIRLLESKKRSPE